MVCATNRIGSSPRQRWSSIAVVGALTVSVLAVAGSSAAADGVSETAWSWGSNLHGQLADGSTNQRLLPEQVLDNVAQVAAGDEFTLAIDTSGRVWAWGENDRGQLGDAGARRGTPQMVPALDSVVAVAVAGGSEHSLMLDDAGQVWSWGRNSSGQLGDGTITQSSVPRVVQGLPTITGLGAGRNHSLAVAADGSIWAWGANSSGQLGDGTTDLRTTPVQLTHAGLPQFAQVSGALDGGASMARALDGTVWTWGANFEGQLGDGTTTARSVPAEVPLPRAAVDVDMAADLSVVLDEDGVVWVWGGNANGGIGNGTTQSPIPVALPLVDVVDVSAGAEHVLVRTSSGAVSSFGWNRWGSLGDGTTDYQPFPVTVQGLPLPVSAVAAGAAHSLAVDADGSLWAWGQNRRGQLGDRSVPVRAAPGRTQLAGTVAVSAGSSHVLTIDTLGAVWAAGWNQYGQLGDGTVLSRGEPAVVPQISATAAVAAGHYHSLAVDGAGAVWAWGSNEYGQLGTSLPSQVIGGTVDQVVGLPVGPVAVAAGEYYSLALYPDGTVWEWGRLDFANVTSTPIQNPTLSDIVAISATDRHNLALDADGNVWTWNRGGGGTTTPVAIPLVAPVVAVAAGSTHGLALDHNGDVWAWGSNFNGQLGDGSFVDSVTPIHVLTGVSHIAAGTNLSLAALADGTVLQWGRLPGLGSDQATPTPVPLLAGAVALAAGGGFAVAIAGAERSATGTVAAGGTVATDPDGFGATVAEPIQVSITSPVAGTITIVDQAATSTPTGFVLLGTQLDITAPAATPTDPLVLVFDVDRGLLPPGVDATNLAVLRNNVAVADCDTGATGAEPDPCIAGRDTLPTGSVRLTVRTSQASVWSIAAVSTPTDVDTPPAVDIGADAQLLVGQAFTGTWPIIDPDPGDSWTVTVDPGDGSPIADAPVTGAEFAIAHTYSSAGSYTVTVTVTDAAGAIGSDTLTVVVQDKAAAVLAAYDALVDDLAIPQQVAEQLRVTLATAATQADAGHLNPAANVLRAHLNQVSAAVRSRKITPAQAAALDANTAFATTTLGL